jgi:hypothetical protein
VDTQADIRQVTALSRLRLRTQQDFEKSGGPARGGTPKDAEFSVIKTLGVVDVLVSGKPTEHRLPQHTDSQWMRASSWAV